MADGASTPPPLRRHSADELRKLSHEALVQLVMQAEERCARLAGLQPGDAPPRDRSPQRGNSAGENAASPAARSGSASPQSSASELLGDDDSGLELGSLAEASFDLEPAPLERALSKVPANVAAAAKLRKELAQAVEELPLGPQRQEPKLHGSHKFHSLTHSNFFLPDLLGEDPAFKRYIHSRLTAPQHQKALENGSVLNWAVGADRDLKEEHRLYVLLTRSDGNCLLHATLLAMWGLHDTQLVGSSGLSSLRVAMGRVLEHPVLGERLRKRWTRQMSLDNVVECESSLDLAGELKIKRPKFVEVSEAQLAREWVEMVEIACRQNAFLDSIHVLAVAHALRRPIIVVANAVQTDPFGVPLTPVFFRGIYLPFECCADNCCRQPLVLCFQDAHFMPLVPQKSTAPCRIPLADGSGEELPLRFALEEEGPRKWELIAKYMDIDKAQAFIRAGVTCSVALMQRTPSHVLVEEMLQKFVERGKRAFAAEQEAVEARDRKRKSEEQAEAAKRRRLPNGAGAPGIGIDNSNAGASVTHKFEVLLPRNARPGDRNKFIMPKNCTDPPEVSFDVPAGCYGGDTVLLTATFAIREHCIAALREVTGVSRDDAVRLLTPVHGDSNLAAQRHFEQ